MYIHCNLITNTTAESYCVYCSYKQFIFLQKNFLGGGQKM